MFTETIKPGDILFVKGTDRISKDIESITKSPYSHVALCTGSSDPSKALIEAQGFRRVGYQRMDSYKGFADVYRVQKGLTMMQQSLILQRAKEHIGQHYDYVLIAVEWVRYTLGVVLPWYEHDVVICSTLVADCFKAAGIDLCPGIRRAYPSPGDEAQSPVLRKVASF